ncbi:MAG: threonine synthase [Deltaproteobacteria bacterium]|nr:MAG: threonine synthase [Deltaproteobacteria bacterium]
MHWEGVIRHYWDYLPLEDDRHVVTLLEGNTPLIPAENLAAAIGLDIRLYLKFEGVNPTGSFKDRGMTMAISKAVEDGAKAVICASTGNTSASAAAYAAKGGLKAYVLIPEGKIALGKLSQAMMHGAEVIQVQGNFDEALKLVVAISDEYPITLVNSINPFRIEGQKTASFEICDVLGRPPDVHVLPVGNAGNITAYWKGYREYHEKGVIDALPGMWGFQAEGAAPIVRGFPIEKPETVATAIRIGNPASWKKAEAARDESGGGIEMVSDDEILSAYRLLSRKEGIFCEPASAAGIAGLIRYGKRIGLGHGEIVVATLTGHGLKDPDNAIKQSRPAVTLPPEKSAIVAHMGF